MNLFYYLIKTIFNANHRGIFDEAMVHFTKLVSADPIFRLGIGIFKVQIIFIALFAEFGSSNVHSDFNFASVPGFFNGFNTKIDSFLENLENTYINIFQTVTYRKVASINSRF